ncbi:J domain-containing protein [Brucella tritici]|uniref:J domain-containing protein n=1 Tax=Brucella tritici TaxID=94626 RepID=A0A6L3YW94_9HYPH|nr:J domain-containing protein [Brucella tritici]KAB2689706.1 J domain-containing protein [Brucella tritici]
MTAAFPLHWPQHRPRTASPVRATFNKKVVRPGKSYAETQSLSIADALGRLQREVDLLGAKQYVLSSNVELRLDGLPRSGQAEPKDRGVALYFHLVDKPHCLPCDRYDRVADNIAAIAKHIEATRAIERYGVADMAEMFAGFTALPPHFNKRNWRAVLGFAAFDHVTKETVEARFKKLAKERHPDVDGGSHQAMAELNQAREEALREVSR